MLRTTPPSEFRNLQGFTLLELMIVVVILGICATFAVPMLNQAAAQTRLEAATELVANSLNYARLRALSSQQNFRVVFTPGTERIRVEMNANNKLNHLKDPSRDVISAGDVENDKSWVGVQHPLETREIGGKDYDLTFTQFSLYKGVDILTASFSGSQTVTFSPQGVPSAGGSVILRFGGQQRTVSLQAVTGVISVS